MNKKIMEVKMKHLIFIVLLLSLFINNDAYALTQSGDDIVAPILWCGKTASKAIIPIQVNESGITQTTNS